MQSSSGMLMIDVGPTAASHLIVGGTATLNGTLKIVYGPGTYSPRTYPGIVSAGGGITDNTRSEEHTSELQSLMRNSYAVFCLKKKTQENYTSKKHQTTNELMVGSDMKRRCLL